MEQEHEITIHIIGNEKSDTDDMDYTPEFPKRTISVDGQLVYSDNIANPVGKKHITINLEDFLQKAYDIPAQTTLLEDPYFHPNFRLPEECYWKMPLWKNREAVSKRTFLGWCMRVIERMYLSTKTEPRILYAFPLSRNHSLPPTPDDLDEMQIILPCQPFIRARSRSIA